MQLLALFLVVAVTLCTVMAFAPHRFKQTSITSLNGVAVAKKDPMSRKVFLDKVSKSTKENFASEIQTAEIEKFILESSGSRIYETYRKRIRKRGKELGIDVPSAWARKVGKYPEPEVEEGADEEGGEETAAEETPAEE